MRISDWSSDVCSSDLRVALVRHRRRALLSRSEIFLRLQHLGALEVADLDREPLDRRGDDEIGRASGRARVCQYVYISVVAVSLKNETQNYARRHEGG